MSKIKTMKDQIEKELEFVDTTCHYQDSMGRNINECEDRLITFCPKCRTFYLCNEDGSREELVWNKIAI